MNKLVHIGAWYAPNHLDHTYGLEILFDAETFDLERIRSSIESFAKDYDQLSDTCNRQQCDAQIDTAAKLMRASLDEDAANVARDRSLRFDIGQMITATAMIYWLEQRGHLQTDNWNGVQFAWQRG